MKRGDAILGNVIWLTVLGVIVSAQVVLGLVWVFDFFPIEVDYSGIIGGQQFHVTPHREIGFYRVFVFLVVGFQVSSLWLLRNRVSTAQLSNTLTRIVGLEAILLAGLILCGAQCIIYRGQYILAENVFLLFLVLSLLSKTMWPRINVVLDRLFDVLDRWLPSRIFATGIDILIGLLVLGAVFIPDREALFSRLFATDRFYHIDCFVMSPGWAALKGLTLNVDTFSVYGVGMPVIVGQVSKLVGGFTYLNVMTVLLGMIIVYYLFLYAFLRVWLRNVMLAAVGLILFLKFQVFHNDAFLVMFPARSVVRFFFDVPFLWLIWLHNRDLKKRYLIAAAVVAGTAIAYVTDTGIYLVVALYAYLILGMMLPAVRSQVYRSRGDVLGTAAAFLLPIGAAVTMLLLLIGPHLFQSVFWSNIYEFIRESTVGFGAIPLHQSINERQYFQLAMGCLIGLVYILTLIVVGSMIYFKKWGREGLFLMTLSIYGLTLYHYYVWRSIGANYYVVCLPYFLLLVYGLQKWFQRLPARKAQRLGLGLFVCSLAALFTAKHFVASPNIFRLARQSGELTQAFRDQEFDIDRDAQRIKELTSPEERVCLLTSFDTAFLIKADRKPFFYHAQLIKSTFMSNRSFEGTTFHMKRDLERMMDQLHSGKPRLVFLEKKIALGGIPEKYVKPGEMAPRLMAYLQNHYLIVEEGDYLYVLRRISN